MCCPELYFALIIKFSIVLNICVCGSYPLLLGNKTKSIMSLIVAYFKVNIKIYIHVIIFALS